MWIFIGKTINIRNKRDVKFKKFSQKLFIWKTPKTYIKSCNYSIN